MSTEPTPVRSPDCPVDRPQCEGPGTYYCDDVIWGSACRRHFERLAAGDETPAENLARRFHEAYERLAPSFNYSTREASAKPWSQVPIRNKRLMVAVAQELLDQTPAGGCSSGEGSEPPVEQKADVVSADPPAGSIEERLRRHRLTVNDGKVFRFLSCSCGLNAGWADLEGWEKHVADEIRLGAVR